MPLVLEGGNLKNCEEVSKNKYLHKREII